MGTDLSRVVPVRRLERLSRYSSIRIGGPVQSVVSVSTPADLEKVFEMQVQGELPLPLCFVGRGTNVLFPDHGFDGTLVRFEHSSTQAAPDWKETGCVRASAAYPLGALAREAARRGIHGFEFLAGIPGTVGGASVMNAGAGGRAWSDLCRSVTLMTRSGDVITIPAEKMQYGYRSSVLSQPDRSGVLPREPPDPEGETLCRSIVLGAELFGEISSVGRCGTALSDHLRYRKATQPLDEPSLGSVFKNPVCAPGGYSAGRLIEESGMKGLARGGIMVSPRHANFFVNTGEGRASEFMDLLCLVMERVKERWGIALDPEVKMWNA